MFAAPAFTGGPGDQEKILFENQNKNLLISWPSCKKLQAPRSTPSAAVNTPLPRPESPEARVAGFGG
jgi:hypothetical protein